MVNILTAAKQKKKQKKEKRKYSSPHIAAAQLEHTFLTFIKKMEKKHALVEFGQLGQEIT